MVLSTFSNLSMVTVVER